jgi:hypothetical protein
MMPVMILLLFTLVAGPRSLAMVMPATMMGLASRRSPLLVSRLDPLALSVLVVTVGGEMTVFGSGDGLLLVARVGVSTRTMLARNDCVLLLLRLTRMTPMMTLSSRGAMAVLVTRRGVLLLLARPAQIAPVRVVSTGGTATTMVRLGMLSRTVVSVVVSRMVLSERERGGAGVDSCT